MNILLQSRKIERAAARWAARLDRGPLAQRDREALQAWLAEDPRHRECLSGCLAFSNDLNDILKAVVPAGEARVAVPEPIFSARLGWQTAGLAAAAVLAVVFAWGSRHPSVRLISAEKREAVELFAGTRADLSAGTRLEIRDHGGSRSVKFLSGQARFTVKHDPTRPFLVETSAGIVRDVGTVFDVSSSNPGKLIVTVFEGSVQFEPAGAQIGASPATDALLVGAGECVASALGQIDHRTLGRVALSDAGAWRDGGVVFQGVPLREAIARVADYNHVALDVSADVPEFRLGGRFQIDDLPGFLESLRRAFPLRVDARPDGSARIAPLPAKK